MARFMTISDAAEELATSEAQIRALIQRGELRAMQIGGRSQWRISRDDLEAYIEAQYAAAAARIAAGSDVEAE